MNAAEILGHLETLVRADQINTNEDDLYIASADRYKKYAMAKRAGCACTHRHCLP